MKRVSLAILAAALLATIAFAETAKQSNTRTEPERYVPSVNFKTDGFAVGAFTIPPAS